MIDTRAAVGSLFITCVAAGSKIVVGGVTATTGDDTKDILSSMGVFGAALAIAYFMLKRGDKREEEMLKSAHTELELVRKEQQKLFESNTAMTKLYIDALVKVADLQAQLAQRPPLH